MKVLQKVLEVFHAQLVIQTAEESSARTSIDRAADALAGTISPGTHSDRNKPATDTPPPESEHPISKTILRQMIDEQLTPLREHVKRLEGELHAVGSGHPSWRRPCP